jgi:hypothetical protein
VKNPKWVEAGRKGWETRKKNIIRDKARSSEIKSKKALRKYCEAHGWHVAFFEGKTGAPRTGIIDAIAYRLGKQNPDEMDLRLIQLKGGRAGVSAEEIARLKKAAADLAVNWLVAEFDEENLHLLQEKSGTLT